MNSFLKWSQARFGAVESNPVAHADLLEPINQLDAEMRTLSDRDLCKRAELLGHEADPYTLPDDEYLIQVCAIVREAAHRTLGMKHYDVQLLAGIALSRNCVAEMATGEGKTLVATLPAVAYGLHRKGVHVMTVNPYLAERDYQTMKPVYTLLGLTTGLLEPGSTPEEKRQAYQCDITYGVGAEFGFDYLRDQISLSNKVSDELGQRFRDTLRGSARHAAQLVQRGHHYAVVDEADSVMIDEARSSLILSGSSGRPHRYPQVYIQARELARELKSDIHFHIDHGKQSVTLLEPARALIHETGRQPSEGLVRPWIRYIDQALRVDHLLQRDREYVVEDDKVQIVDEFTGRRLEDRTWSEGLHQAVEAVEETTITEESYSMLRISRQRYLGFYQYLSGMTGTATGCEKEIRNVFNLPVVQIPLRRPSQRRSLAARFYVDRQAKWQAIMEELSAIHRTGQPLLIGTRTVGDSEALADLLAEHGYTYRLLNARQDREEAEIIGRAGNINQITIATNLAGRGADIPLGPGVAELGGLFVIAVEPHESARVDRQLAGRCARQGDPGLYRLYVSAEDDLLQQYGNGLIRRMKLGRHIKGQLQTDYSAALKRIQTRIDKMRYKQRQRLYRHDKWMEELLEKTV